MPRLAYLAIGFLPSVVAQIVSKAVCTSPDFTWATNSVGDSPCLVAAQLAGVCNGGVFTLDALPAGFQYLGPSVTVQNSCRCSSVYYSMLSACAGCQGRDWLPWDQYNPNCTVVYPRVFPQSLPAGTKVPAWAYADVAATNNFDVGVARGLGDSPESTASPVPTSNTLGTSRTFPLVTAPGGTLPPQPTRTSPTVSGGDSSPPPGSSSGSNAGAIAGGVIGGVVALALIAGILFFLRRQRRGKPASSAFNTTPYTPAPYNSDPGMVYTPTTSPFPASQKLYDPSDPSTFPSTPAPPGSSAYTPTTGSPPPVNFSANTFHGSSAQVGHVPPSMPSPGRYTGAPEI